ncbi:MAG: dTDP-4-dehydrorhamnose 3,5-epimerase family protein [Candidatus Aenigmarchaeota archaeon]|nr:dTDP-4-dehydrorhamnose 3,5-epimerase family protein [Candidatus Aenigmarchaeota archaeon]
MGDKGGKRIDGVEVKRLSMYEDGRGRLMEILRADDSIFRKFGQVYMCTAYPGWVKGWHLHKRQTDNFTCIKGTMRLVLYDGREKSATKGLLNEFIISLETPMVVSIPPGVYHGFEALGRGEAIAINTPDYPYNRKRPDEYRLPFNTGKIGFKWKGKRGG